MAGFALDGAHRLRAADSFSNFDGYEETSSRDTIVAATAGWWMVSKFENEKGGWWSPIVARAIECGGFSPRAVTVPDDEGYSEPIEASKTVRFILAPDRAKPGSGDWPPEEEWGRAELETARRTVA